MLFLIILLILLITCLVLLVKTPVKKIIGTYANIVGENELVKGDIVYSNRVTKSLLNEKIIYILNSILYQYLSKIYNINRIDYNWLHIEKDTNNNYFIIIDCFILYTKLDTVQRHINIDMSISNKSNVCIYKIRQGNNIIDKFIDKDAHHSYNTFTNLIQ